jgi:hypothetical protein
MSPRREEQPRPVDPRQRAIEDLALVTAELLDQFRTVERYDWQPSRHGLGLSTERRPNGKYVQPLPKPKRNQRHVLVEPGLLRQVQLGAGRRRAVAKTEAMGYDPTLGYRGYVDASALVGVEAPIQSATLDSLASRGPGPMAVLEAYVDLVAGIEACRQQMRAAAGKPRGRRQSPTASLRELTRLLLERKNGRPVLADAWAQRALRRAKSWSSTARLALSYDAPIVEITGTQCSECGGRLLVRADATSDLWCAGVPGRAAGVWTGEHPGRLEGPSLEGDAWPRPDRGCGARWPRHGWLALLEGRSAG